VADWVTISALATAGGTLALAGTTYAAVRSGNRSARTAEQTLLAGLRPLLVQSSPDDQPQRIRFVDEVRVTAPGGGAGVEVIDGKVYLVVSLRNVGPGIGVLHGGYLYPDPQRASMADHAPVASFHRLTRDIYIPSGKMGFWQIACRDENDPERVAMVEAVERGAFGADILYGDYEGGQRVITRFGLFREDDGVWRHSAVRHWQLDRVDPR